MSCDKCGCPDNGECDPPDPGSIAQWVLEPVYQLADELHERARIGLLFNEPDAKLIDDLADELERL